MAGKKTVGASSSKKPPPFPVTNLPPPPLPLPSSAHSPPKFPPLPPTPPLTIRPPAVETPPTPLKLVARKSANRDGSKYDLYFHNSCVRVVATSSPRIAANWVKTTYKARRRLIQKGQLVVGIGAQYSTPSGPTTIALCAGTNCLVFHLHRASYCPPALKNFLADANVAFVRLDNCMDLYDALASSKYGLVVKRLMDLRPLAITRDFMVADAGMETMADKILGLKGMVKDEAVEKESNWEEKKLSEDQVKFVTVDAFLCCLMGMSLGASKYVAYDVQDQPK